jgi:hypothetical protein
VTRLQRCLSLVLFVCLATDSQSQIPTDIPNINDNLQSVEVKPANTVAFKIYASKACSFTGSCDFLMGVSVFHARLISVPKSVSDTLLLFGGAGADLEDGYMVRELVLFSNRALGNGVLAFGFRVTQSMQTNPDLPTSRNGINHHLSMINGQPNDTEHSPGNHRLTSPETGAEPQIGARLDRVLVYRY